MIFRGTFEHALDAKHRLTVPAKFRAALSGGVVLATSHEPQVGQPRCMAIWTPEGYERFVESALESLNPLSPQGRELSRFFNNNAYDTELDSAHRLMIPAPLRAYAGLQKNVMVTGSGTHLEVWDRDSYSVYRDEAMGRVTEIAASLGNTP